MKRLIFIIVIGLSLIGCAKLPKPPNALHKYQINNVNVLDVINEKLLLNQQVTVTNGVIQRVSAEHKIQDKDTSQIDGRGKFLIPGLWDSHVILNKLSDQIDFPLYLANGVTSVRSILNCPNEQETSLYACLADKKAWNDKVSSGQLVGPHILGSATFPINGTDRVHPDSPSFYGGRSVKEANQIVAYYQGFDEAIRPHSLKVYNNLEPEVYRQLVAEANQAGFKISGHKPRKLSLTDAISAGQYSFAHARLFLYECSSFSEELIAEKHWDKPLPEFYAILLDSYDADKCQHLYREFAESQAFLSPTLLTRRNDYLSLAGLKQDVYGIDYVPYMFEREWSEDIEVMQQAVTSPEQLAQIKRFYLQAAKTVADAYHSGATILAGTDSYDTYVVPGFSLHEELFELSKAGIDNFGVLQAATINMARYFEISDIDGSIDEGKVANMVLLNANPVEDIRHSRDIAMVFQGNLVFDQKQLEALKEHAKTEANSHGFSAQLIGLFIQNPTGF